MPRNPRRVDKNLWVIRLEKIFSRLRDSAGFTPASPT
jgi:hypothetical protein